MKSKWRPLACKGDPCGSRSMQLFPTFDSWWGTTTIFCAACKLQLQIPRQTTAHAAKSHTPLPRKPSQGNTIIPSIICALDSNASIPE